MLFLNFDLAKSGASTLLASSLVAPLHEVLGVEAFPLIKSKLKKKIYIYIYIG